MSIEANKAVVRRFFEEVGNDRKVEVLDEIVAEEFRQYALNDGALQSSLRLTGRAALRKMVTGVLATFPDWRFTIDDLLAAEDDRVVIRFTARGTHTGGPFLGIPPTGKIMTLQAIHIFRLRNGLIVERWTCSDRLSSLQQLGAQIISPGGTSPSEPPL